jgi:hypothetical protein
MSEEDKIDAIESAIRALEVYSDIMVRLTIVKLEAVLSEMKGE